MSDGFQEAVITEADLQQLEQDAKANDTKAEAKPSAPAVDLSAIPEKFRNAEDPIKAMAEAYANLEKKQSQPKPKAETKKVVVKKQVPDTNEDGTPKVDADGKPVMKEVEEEVESSLSPEEEEATKDMAPALKTALEKASDDYFKSGEISDDARKALNDLGISDEYIDQYTQGYKGEEERILSTMYNEAGGEERFNDMLKWAAGALTQQEIAAVDNVLQNSQSVEEIKNTVIALNKKYTDAVGAEPKNVRGQRSAASGDVFRSEQEVIAAMSDARYQSGDAAYIREVEAKLARSHEVFTNFQHF